jgi:ribosome-associated protein
LDVADRTDVFDHIIIATGNSNRQIKALADNVVEEGKKSGPPSDGRRGHWHFRVGARRLW